MRSRSDRDELLKSATFEERGLFSEVHCGADMSRYEDEFTPSRRALTSGSDREMLFVWSHRLPIRVPEDHSDRIACLSSDGL